MIQSAAKNPTELPIAYLSPLHQGLECALAEFNLLLDDTHDRDARNSPTVRAFAEAAALDVEPIPKRRMADALRNGDVLVGIGSDEVMTLAGRGRTIRRLVAHEEGNHRERVARRRAISEGKSLQWLAFRPLETMSAVTSDSERMGPWDRLRGLAQLERTDVRAIIFYAMALGVLSLATPIAIQALVNTVAFGGVLLPLIVLIAALFVGLMLAASLQVVQAYIAEILQRRFLVRVAEDLGRKLPMASKDAQDEKDLRELTNRFFDVITVQKTTIQLLLTGSSLALQTSIGILLLAFYHPWLMVFSVLLVFSIAGVTYLGRGGTETAQKESKAKFAVAAWLQELAREPDLFYAGPGREFCAERLDERLKDYIESRKKHFRHVLSVLIGGASVQVLSIVLVLAFGGYLVMERQLTLGQLVAAEIVVGAIAAGIGKFGKLAEKTFDSLAALDKLGYLFDLPSRTHGLVPLESNGPMRIQTTNLALMRGGTVLRTVADLNVEPKEHVWIDSRSGSGVTTLLDTLAGHRRPAGGEILWDGRRYPNADDLAYQVQLLRPGSLIAGSVRDNLRVVCPDADDSQMWDVLTTVGLSETIEELGGLHAILHSAGEPLSKVERAQLIMARAVLLRPRLLLIDHVLDIEQGEVREALWRIAAAPDAPWTLIVASEQPDTETVCCHRYQLAQPEILDAE